ncbi:hypothetical protein BGX28_005533 [Mortierella sp. GBA30]|nr:hypothetical protein BGX28_005533 [Mortierella sp. GBA30]
MLYLDDRKLVVRLMDDLAGYDGKVSSCIDIVTKLCNKHQPVKVAEMLNKRYEMDMPHVHRCIAIYLGGLGTMDDEYIKRYPKSNLSSLGTTLMEYNSAVRDIMALATLVEKAKLLEYSLDSFSVVYQCGIGHELNLDEMFDGMKEWVEIALQYGPLHSTFAGYNGDTERVRRRISTLVDKNIPKRYVEFIPKAMDRVGVIMAHWNGKDYKVYRDKFVFDCGGDDLDNVGMYASKVMSAFGINNEQIAFSYQSNTKASLRVEIDNWNVVVLEDLIINDEALGRIMSMANGVLHEDITEETLHKDRFLVVYIAYPRTRCVFRYTKGMLKISIASLSVDDTAIVVSVAIISRLLKKYRRDFANIYERYKLHAKKSRKSIVNIKPHSKIDALRSRLPELFANNYTRECHNLPVMLDTEEEAEKYRKMGRSVIKYPLHGKYSRWFTSPSDDLYVGIKINRLCNKDKFKHIVTCYTSNHLENPSRETYVYYHGDNGIKRESSVSLITLRILPTGRRGPLPAAMAIEHNLDGYSRLGTGGPFLDCIAHALDVNAKKFPKLVRKGVKDGLLNVVRQEMWDRTNEEILVGIDDSLDGTKYYRLFEEVYQCNIIIVEIGHRGKYTVSIPECKGKYIWEPRKGKYIIVTRNEKRLYEDHMISYELVINQDKMVFDKKDPLVLALKSIKLTQTVRSDVKENDVQSQYITEHGKCNIVITKDGIVKCNSRPLYKPLVDVEVVRERSAIYNYLGNIPIATTAKHLYFPDNISFVDWWNK